MIRIKLRVDPKYSGFSYRYIFNTLDFSVYSIARFEKILQQTLKLIVWCCNELTIQMYLQSKVQMFTWKIIRNNNRNAMTLIRVREREREIKVKDQIRLNYFVVSLIRSIFHFSKLIWFGYSSWKTNIANIKRTFIRSRAEKSARNEIPLCFIPISGFFVCIILSVWNINFILLFRIVAGRN